jgi:leucyl-tRNA synthetase
MDYGTGAIMAVPAHDQRDFDFARKYKIPIRVVIKSADSPAKGEEMTEAYTGEGIMVNSGEFNGLTAEEGRKRIIAYMEKHNIGQAMVNYRLRDWLISRQRYWGAPIPIVYCNDCGIVPVPEKDLPVTLPHDVEFKPFGESPLSYVESFYKTTCPIVEKKQEEKRIQWTPLSVHPGILIVTAVLMILNSPLAGKQ